MVVRERLSPLSLLWPGHPGISLTSGVHLSAAGPLSFIYYYSRASNQVMSLIALLTLIAVWVTNVQARNETLIHGWRAEPQGRGTWSILWSCLATIFICTWSALHLSVSERHGRWNLFFRKLGAMLVATAAPEFMLYNSAVNFFEARDLLKTLRNRGNREWTLTHLQFACANGFRTRTPDGDLTKCSAEQLWSFIENKSIDGPPLSEDELQARGRSDLVVKLVAVLQIIWFVVQTLVRAIQHYQIAALEIMTVAFVFCSVFIYAFTLYQPQDVVYPVILEPKLITPPPDQSETLTKSKSATTNDDPSVCTPDLAHSSLPSKYVPGLAADTVPFILFGLFACGFGALHCLAWNSPFPTAQERLAWRICSATTTALPALVALFVVILIPLDQESLLSITLWSICVVYIIGRAALIVLAFMSLRALPADTFQTVDWNNYFPHFAA